jgi:hypothetical protein
MDRPARVPCHSVHLHRVFKHSQSTTHEQGVHMHDTEKSALRLDTRRALAMVLAMHHGCARINLTEYQSQVQSVSGSYATSCTGSSGTRHV